MKPQFKKGQGFVLTDRSKSKIDHTGWSYDTLPLGHCKECGHSIDPRFAGALIGDCIYCGRPYKFDTEARKWVHYDYAEPVKPYLETVELDAITGTQMHPNLIGKARVEKPLNKLMLKREIA